jgi:hypothetical protein
MIVAGDWMGKIQTTSKMARFIGEILRVKSVRLSDRNLEIQDSNFSLIDSKEFDSFGRSERRRFRSFEIICDLSRIEWAAIKHFQQSSVT